MAQVCDKTCKMQNEDERWRGLMLYPAEFHVACIDGITASIEVYYLFYRKELAQSPRYVGDRLIDTQKAMRKQSSVGVHGTSSLRPWYIVSPLSSDMDTTESCYI